MALTAKFLADFTDFYSAVSKATSQLDGLQKEANESGLALNKMVTSLSGEKAIKDAMSLAAAVEALGGTSKLTAAELEKVGKKAAEAVEKAKALGVDVPPELQKLADANKKTSSSFDSGAASLTKWAVGLVSVTAAIELAKAGFSAVIGFLSDSVKAAAGAQAAQAQLTATMASHGVAVPEVIAAYQGYISALAKTTTQSDDALTASAALLTTMGVMPREMNAALTAATNLAERFGGGEQGLAKATEAVGKAAMGQTASLAKAGIQLDDTKVKAEGFQYVVTQVNDQLGGAAVAAANTFSGRLTQLANSWDEVKEAVGRAITENQTVIDLMKKVSEALQGVEGDLSDNQKMTLLVSDSVILLVRSIALLGTAFSGIGGFVKGAAKDLHGFVELAIKVNEVLIKAMGTSAINAPHAEALKSMRMELLALSDSLSHTVGYISDAQVVADKLAKEADRVTASLEETKGQTVQLTAATNQNTNAINLSTANLKGNEAALKAKAAADKEAAAAAKKAMDAFTEAMRKLEGGAQGAVSEVGELPPELMKTTAALELTRPAIGRVVTAVETLPPAFNQAWLGVKGFGDNVSEYLAQDFGEAVVKGIQGGGNVVKGVVADFGSKVFGSNSAFAKGLQKNIGDLFGPSGIMGTIGKSLSGLVPMIGTFIGPAIEGVTKLFSAVFGKSEESSKVSPLRDEFFKLQGGIESLNPRVEALTGNLSMVQAVFDAKTVEEYNAAIANLNTLFAQEQEALGLVTETAKKYGLTLEELGPAFARQELDKKAQELYKDYQVLIAAGVKNTTVTKKMADEVNKYVQQAMKMGVAVPSAMKPMLEQMAKAGVLTDSSGKKIKDVEKSGIKFALTMSEGFEKLIDSVQQLTHVIAGSLGVQLEKTKDRVNAIPNKINIKVNYDEGDRPKALKSGTVSVKGYQGGTKGFEDFGAGTLVMLHGREAVVPEHAVKRVGGGGPVAASAGVTIVINAQGSFFDTPGDLQRLAEKVNAALTAKHGLTNRSRAA